jgi:hypothetical protein
LNILLACTATTGEACCLKERAKRRFADDVKQATTKDGGKAGALFRRLVAGLVVMVEARARQSAARRGGDRL